MRATVHVPLMVTGGFRTAHGISEALRSGATPLVGREEEIEMLKRRWESARGGEGRGVTDRAQSAAQPQSVEIGAAVIPSPSS